MSITAAQLLVRVNADTAAAEASLGAMSGKLAALGMPAAVAVAAVGAIGVASVVMAGNFQESMTQLVTGAGESQSNLKMVSDGILQLANDTGTSTKQLAAGMFMIESAGFHGAAGLNILKIAAEGAKVGNADLGTTADALTTILKDYPNVTGGATGGMNLLIATVANGKTHMEDLASSLSQVLPAASSAGIGINDVMAAMATMTGEGVPAAEAATYLRQTIIALDAPSKQAKDALAAIGLSSTQVAAEAQKNLPAALKMIQDRLAAVYGQGSPQYVAALRNIAGGSKQMQGMLDLTGVHMSSFQANLNNVTGAVKKGHGEVTGWNLVQGNFNQHMAVAREKVETMFIGLGQHLLPVVQRLVDAIANHIIPALENFAGWLTGNSKSIQQWRPLLQAVAIMIGGALVAAFVAWAISAASAAVATLAAMAPVLLIGAAIAMVIAVIILIVRHWDVLSAKLGAFAGGVGSAVGNAFSGLGTLVHNVWGGIEGAIKGAINGVIGVINNFIRFIDGIQIHIPSIGVGPVHSPAFNWNGLGIKTIPALAAGGTVGIGGAAIVGEAGMELLTVGGGGARVTPLTSGSPTTQNGLSGNNQPMTLVLQVDGRTLASIVTKYQPGVIRQSLGVRAF